jgi:hypothetical protein
VCITIGMLTVTFFGYFSTVFHFVFQLFLLPTQKISGLSTPPLIPAGICGIQEFHRNPTDSRNSSGINRITARILAIPCLWIQRTSKINYYIRNLCTKTKGNKKSTILGKSSYQHKTTNDDGFIIRRLHAMLPLATG